MGTTAGDPTGAQPTGTVTLDLRRDFGDSAPDGDLIVDTSWMLERLGRYLADLPMGFNTELALHVIGERSLVAPPPMELPSGYDDLNEDQLEALRLSLSCPAALVVGPPGTGKTRTLACAAEAHFRLGRRVLVVAPSNAAADEAALCIASRLEHKPQFDRGLLLRLGTVGPGMLRSRFGAQVEYLRVLTRLVGANPALGEQTSKSLLANARVIVTTLHTMFLSPRVPGEVETVLVDEAGMATLPHLFAAAGRATRHVTCFGDYQQLGPVVSAKTPSAREWLRRDVFHAHGVPLARANGDRTPGALMLRCQHRMAPLISRFTSELFYHGELRPHHSLQNRAWTGKSEFWGPLTCLDTSRLGARATFPSNARVNLCHGKVVEMLLDDFVMAEELVPGEPGNASVAILAPYRGQVQLFRDVIRRRRLTQSVRAGTVHRLQGQEADIVVLDLSDASGAELSLFFRDYLEETEAERLLNVAVSRARHRLIVIMDLDFLDRAAPRWGVIHRFIAALREHATIIDAAELMPPTRAWSAVS